MRAAIAYAMLFALSGCALLPATEKARQDQSRVPVKEYASFPLANCTPEMDQPEFWIAKLTHPDKVLLTSAEIARLNQQALDSGLLIDVFSDRLWEYKYLEVDRSEEINPDARWNTPAAFCPGLVGGYTLYTYLKDETERIKARVRYDVTGQPVPRQVFTELDDNLNLRGIHEDNPIRYGMTVRRSDFRFYPTDQLMTSEPWDSDFDVIQVSAINAMQPLAILHQSRDQKWLFAVSPICRGWLPRKDVAEHAGYRELQPFLQPEKILVVTGHAVGVAEAPGDTRTAERLYLGTACPLVGRSGDYYEVLMPGRGPEGRLVAWTGYVAGQAEVHEGYLPYTARQLYTKAFQQLRTPYAWGGKGEFRDCSQFVMDLYATMGLRLPRNSAAQANVGRARVVMNGRKSRAQRQQELARLQGPALLQFPGHIMLYLGQVNDQAYAIHDIWAYRAMGRDDDRKIIIGQVTVSDLSLGDSSKRGSLLDRITTINSLRP